MAKVAPATVTLPSSQPNEDFAGMDATNAVPASGLAIFPEYINRNGLKLILKGHNSTKGMMASNMSGDPLFFIDGEYSSSSCRTVTDAATEDVIFQIRKDGSGSRNYVAEIEDDGKPLFEITRRRRMLHRDIEVITFVNKADPNRGMVEMEYTFPTVVSDGGFRINGNLVVLVKKEGVGPASPGCIAAVIDRLKDESGEFSRTARF